MSFIEHLPEEPSSISVIVIRHGIRWRFYFSDSNKLKQYLESDKEPCFVKLVFDSPDVAISMKNILEELRIPTWIKDRKKLKIFGRFSDE